MGEKSKSKLGWANEPTVRPASRIIITLTGLGLGAAFCFFPASTFRALLTAIALVSVAYAILRLWACCLKKPVPFSLPTTTELPKYTVLVPLFHEANIVEPLTNALAQINYPQDRLQILLLCEEIDPVTIRSVQLYLRPPFELIIVPAGKPQTKPRALNYAMKYATGEIVTIYDAEDRPHPNQLLAAVSAFEHRPDWAAVQAPLDYYNASQNWLTRQFALEYAALFHVWLPFLTQFGLPFPLGGTSNHMRRSALREIDGWDAYNVTEDADLSFRLAALGHKIGYITPPTYEEAVSRPRDWHFQRARWIKGYQQTWDVQMGDALAPGGAAGLIRFMTLQLTLGFTLLSIWFFAPAVIFFMGLIYLSFLFGWTLEFQPIWIAGFLFSMAAGSVIGAVGAKRAGYTGIARACIYMPFYWLMLFAPSLRAAWERLSNPYHWHKTTHGLGPGETNTQRD